tara:strand:- start:139 stop:828 length:690 start_codon:yes stop_codon:yes gene_type:complete
MKTIVLLITGLLFGIAPVAAEHKSASQGEDLNTRFYNDQPILFIERGVEFLVFPDGSFDFNTELNTTPGDIYYRRNSATRVSSRVSNTTNVTYGAPRVNHVQHDNFSNGVIITHDSEGRVRRIGNVFLNYNYYGQLKRVGSVYLRYNRNGLVSQIGGLRIHYHHRTQYISHTSGYVNHYNKHCGICNTPSCGINHYQYNPSHHSPVDYDYYYYKKGDKIKKVKRLKSKK